jgi:MFS family permease
MSSAQSTFTERYTLGPALAAAAALAIGVGFGRFAFTGLYPLMVQDDYLSVHSGALAASANYAGYLLGALLVARTTPERARVLCLWALIMTMICMAALTYVRADWGIIAIRGLAGVFSAFAMVGASLWMLQYIGQARSAPLLYAGVGVGIAASAEVIALGHHYGLGSETIWMLLALSSLALGLACVPALNSRPTAELAYGQGGTAGPTSRSASALDAARLIGIYGLAGFGYIITATYLPLLIEEALGSVDPLQVWAVFGLGAVPSCFLWHALNVRYGTRKSLLLNLTVQAVGVLLPVLSQTAPSYLASALLVGGTFMGTVTVAMPAARHMAHVVRFNMLAGMTAAYGVGQIIGPLVANAIYTSSQSFTGSLLTAAAALVAGAALCLGIGTASRSETR